MSPAFTSHNILLPDGTQTAPGRPLVAGSGACRAALRYLAAEFGSRRDITVADLGCLEGGYAAEFARAGYTAVGIEARQENYGRAAWLPGALALPNLRFLHGDVREVLPGTAFDAVFCCGLLYHLDRPVAFLDLLGQVTRRLLILNTHYSMEGGHPEGIHQPGERCDPGPAWHEGRAGHWFRETENRWASSGGTSSFWLRKDDLTEAIAAAGFTRVAERDDWRDDPAGGLPFGSGGAFADRGMFTAVKP